MRVWVCVCVSMQVSKRLSMSNITTQSFKGNLALIEEKLMVSCMKSIDKVLLGKCDHSSTFSLCRNNPIKTGKLNHTNAHYAKVIASYNSQTSLDLLFCFCLLQKKNKKRQESNFAVSVRIKKRSEAEKMCRCRRRRWRCRCRRRRCRFCCRRRRSTFC